MKIFFLRLFFILSLVFFQFSFFNILFSRVSVPIILIVAVVAWTLIVGFPRVLYMVIPLSIFFDIASFGALGALTLYAVPLAYATDFLSRRLLAEHHGMGMILYALFASLGSFGYGVFHFVFTRGSSFLWSAETVTRFFRATGFLELLLPIFSSVVFFPILYWSIRRFETYMSFAVQKEILQMR
ncbi:MAG: hypothetical protein Q7S04_00805 [Candidatus Moranbacteria bacterium]|nr:hypothetical protein [Candidatus Moranbacteria bacterium]